MDSDAGYREDTEKLQVEVQKAAEELSQVIAQAQKVVVGQNNAMTRLVMALVSRSHVLLEGFPGLAKTTMVKTLAEVTGLNYNRIQFTPDLLPADVIGTQIYDPSANSFTVKKGPIFANIVLADEINRAPAKVQSAMLECMAEKQVSIGGETFGLAAPFLVLATQNPIEQEGTYQLPEAQLDRFLFKLNIGYSSFEEEIEIVRRSGLAQPKIEPMAGKDKIEEWSNLVNRIHVADKVRSYIVDLIYSSRKGHNKQAADLEKYIAFGASPRASIAMEKIAKVNAMFEGRSFVTPQDIKDIAHDILRHRIIPSFEAEVEGINSDNIVSQLLERVDVP